MKTKLIRWRTIALPTEHGGWGFIGEPIVLGLMIAPSAAGVMLSITALALFLLRQPLKVWLKDRIAHRHVPRTWIARRFILIYGGIALIAGLGFLLTGVAWTVLWPLLIALPLIAWQLYDDLRYQGRDLRAEVIGASVPGVIVTIFTLIQGWPGIIALALWFALAVKGIGAVFYVRARLRLERGETIRRDLPIIAHGIGFGLFAIAVGTGILIWTVLIAMAVLTVRCVVGLSAWRKARPAKVIGVQEVGYGLMFVILIAIGHIF
ncbi:MAG: YwiC-like family protein [Anaerolineae bacterium]|nr:YwiC-like family protein [Anaerolineae bacterium]